MSFFYVRKQIGWLRKRLFAGQADIWLSSWVNTKMFPCTGLLSKFFQAYLTLKWFFIQVNCSLVNASRMISLKFFITPFIAAIKKFPGFLYWTIWDNLLFGMNQNRLSRRFLTSGRRGYVMERRRSFPVIIRMWLVFGLGILDWSQAKDTQVLYLRWMIDKHWLIGFLLWSAFSDCFIYKKFLRSKLFY